MNIEQQWTYSGYFDIWRNDVLFNNLHSGHLGISMMDSNTTVYIERKNYFQIIQQLAIRKYFFLIWFCTLLNPELECVSLFTKWREVGGSFFIWKFEAELHNNVMIYSKERAFDAFWKLILKYLPFIFCGNTQFF